MIMDYSADDAEEDDEDVDVEDDGEDVECTKQMDCMKPHLTHVGGPGNLSLGDDYGKDDGHTIASDNNNGDCMLHHFTSDHGGTPSATEPASFANGEDNPIATNIKPLIGEGFFCSANEVETQTNEIVSSPNEVEAPTVTNKIPINGEAGDCMLPHIGDVFHASGIYAPTVKNTSGIYAPM
ncbi:hypothetical protein L2E82_10046 [Cichorium intybus]|uniref:Uncharacterized protein n=1 Tax=Cichorium intybus TaxID=13427 RepID=A0ACB9G9P7_CICIN|nr:hypothetical protein L2E82_10046 [Cichorium intybus]